MIKWYLRNLRELPTIAHCIGPRFTFSCSSLWRRMLSTIRLPLCLKVLHEHTCTTQWARSPGSRLALHTSISIHSSVLCCVLVLRRTQPLNSGDRQQWTDEHTGCWLQSWLLDNVDCKVAPILPRIDNRRGAKFWSPGWFILTRQVLSENVFENIRLFVLTTTMRVWSGEFCFAF